MKKTIISIALALCLCISSHSAAYAQEEVPYQQEEVFTAESTSESPGRNNVIPSPSEAYAKMIALKKQEAYKEGTIWTNYEPYPNSMGRDYHWKGGPLDGHNISAVGCVAFAFILSDAAFDSLPARMYTAGKFKYEDIKPGDILRVNNDAHTVIVLEANVAGVIVAEGNISTGDHKGKIHWGRAISKEEVMGSTSHYITRYPEGYISPDDPDANKSIGSGSLDGGLKWNLTKAGKLTISGNGAMPDFDSSGNQPWIKNSSQIRNIVIENGVTSIGSCAFWNCGVLSADIPSSVTKIGNSAFRGSSIISAKIPSSVKIIGDSAFRECANLSSVAVSNGVETIEQNAFRSCPQLTAIALPASIKEVGAAAFLQCQALTTVTFAPGNTQVKMGDNMFMQCYYLMKVTLPKSIDRISEGMFQNCLTLAGVEIPKGAESIDASAFASCSAFTTVIIPDSVTSIGIAAFTKCPLSKIYFTGTEEQWKSISKIGDTASALEKVTMHYNYVPPVTPDPDDSNGNDDGNGNGDNNNNGDNSGDGNNSGNGDNLGSNSGNNNNSGSNNNSDSGDTSGNGESQTQKPTPLAKGKTFTVNKATYKVTKAGNEVELSAIKSTTAKVTLNTVTGTDGVKYKVTSIGSKAMQNNKKITTLTIGSNVKSIGANAFAGCTKLKTVTIGNTSKSNLTTIGKNSFKGCKKLKKVTIKSTKLRSVGKQAFKGTKSSLKVKAPSKQVKKYKKLFKKAGLKTKQVTK